MKLRNIRHDLMLNEHPQELADSIMKPSRSKHSSSDKIYKGTVIISYIKNISEKFGHTGHCFSVRTIFKTKHTLCGTLMKTGLVRDAQETKQCDSGRCYIGETSRTLQVYIKEHKYNLT
jgi:hypothetical protein